MGYLEPSAKYIFYSKSQVLNVQLATHTQKLKMNFKISQYA